MPFQTLLLFSLLSLMITERILYRVRTGVENSDYDFFTKNVMLIKICIHFTLVITVHLMLVFYWPLYLNMRMSETAILIGLYFTCIPYFVFSSLQIQHGYP